MENNKSRAIRDDRAPGLLEKGRAGLAERERRRKGEMKKRNATGTIEMRDDERLVSAEKTHGIQDGAKDSSSLK